MSAVSVTDEVIHEIGEQVSRTLVRKHASLRGLDLYSGMGMYENHLRTYSNVQDIRKKKNGSENQSKDKQVPGKAFEVLDVHERRREGKRVYTTDELAKLRDDDPDDPLFRENPDLIRRDLAKTNHAQTDVVEIRPDGTILTYQHKKVANVGTGVNGFLVDSDNDYFVVPEDQYEAYVSKLVPVRERGLRGSGVRNCATAQLPIADHGGQKNRVLGTSRNRTGANQAGAAVGPAPEPTGTASRANGAHLAPAGGRFAGVRDEVGAGRAVSRAADGPDVSGCGRTPQRARRP